MLDESDRYKEKTIGKIRGMYSSQENRKGSEIINVITSTNQLSDLENLTNIGYADSLFEYWFLPPGISSKRLTETLIDQGLDHDIKNILVVGCGRGGELLLLQDITGSEVVGVDLSRNNLEHAKSLIRENEKEDEIKLVKSTAENLPFEDGSFSVVYSCEAAFHFHKKSFIQEGYRVLKDGGRLLIGDITKREGLSSEQIEILNEHTKMLNAYNFFSKKDYSKVLEKIFRRTPQMTDITEKNLKYLATGSDILVRIFSILEKLPGFKKLIKKRLMERGIDIDVFLEDCRTTKLSYENSVIEYLLISCEK